MSDSFDSFLLLFNIQLTIIFTHCLFLGKIECGLGKGHILE